MFTFFKPVVAVCSILSLGACASAILRADEDRYSGSPALSILNSQALVGLPEGDRWQPGGASGSITDSTPGGLGRAFRLNDQIEFVATSHDEPDRYTVVWSGVHTNGPNDVTRIILREENGAEALRFRYDINSVEVIWGEDVGIAPVILLGDTPHEITVAIRPKGVPRADVTITVGDETIFSKSNLSLIDSDFEQFEVIEIVPQSEYYMKDLIAVAVEN